MFDSSNTRGLMLRRVLQWVTFGALTTVAIVYFAAPSGADDRQAPWSAEMWEMEGGEAFVAVVRGNVENIEEMAPSLMLTCRSGNWALRYDAGLHEPAYAEWLNRSAVFDFDFGDSLVQREMLFEAMDAVFYAPLADSDVLLQTLASGTTVSIAAAEPDFPENTFTLQGSAAALAALRAACD